MHKKTIILVIMLSVTLTIVMFIIFPQSSIEIINPKNGVTVFTGDFVNFEAEINEGHCFGFWIYPLCKKIQALPFNYGVELRIIEQVADSSGEVHTRTHRRDFRSGNLKYKFSNPGVYQITAGGLTAHGFGGEITTTSNTVTVKVTTRP